MDLKLKVEASRGFQILVPYSGCEPVTETNQENERVIYQVGNTGWWGDTFQLNVLWVGGWLCFGHYPCEVPVAFQI